MFIKTWDEWMLYRKERRLPKLLPRSVQKQWDRLAGYGCDIAIAAIEESIANQYQGIFPDRIRGPQVSRVGGSDRLVPVRASLGALQVQLKQVEEELEDLIRPGGCAFPRTLTLEQSVNAEKLREQRRRIKERMNCL